MSETPSAHLRGSPQSQHGSRRSVVRFREADVLLEVVMAQLSPGACVTLQSKPVCSRGSRECPGENTRGLPLPPPVSAAQGTGLAPELVNSAGRSDQVPLLGTGVSPWGRGWPPECQGLAGPITRCPHMARVRALGLPFGEDPAPVPRAPPPSGPPPDLVTSLSPAVRHRHTARWASARGSGGDGIQAMQRARCPTTQLARLALPAGFPFCC